MSRRPTDLQNQLRMQQIADLFGVDPTTTNYLTHVSERHHFVYVETPKVACTSIKRALQIVQQDGTIDGLVDNVHDRKNSPLGAPSTVTVPVDDLYQGSSFFRFCFVRDPFTRVLSAYLDKIVTNTWERERLLPQLGFKPSARISLKVFLKTIRADAPEDMDIHWMPQTTLLRPDRVRYDMIGRFEVFSEDFSAIIRRFDPTFFDGRKGFDYSRHKTGAASKAADLIGPEEADLVREIYASDFIQFDYDPDAF